MRHPRLVACLLAAPLLACSRPREADAPAIASASATAASPSGAPSLAVSAPRQAASAPAGAGAAVEDGRTPGAAPAPSANDSDVPPVEVTNIGMHIGGGPNDDETKAPIRRSVAPHLAQFGRCWRLVEHTDRAGDFGVDLRIPRGGGKAAVSHPRTAIRGDGFERCVVEAFERIEFERPRGGDTVVSYSLRFTPKR